MENGGKEKKSRFRLIIAGGGTGGHLFPGIAVARELKKRVESTEVLFVIGRRDMGSAYNRADIVVGRAGATTISELAGIGQAFDSHPLPPCDKQPSGDKCRYLGSSRWS